MDLSPHSWTIILSLFMFMNSWALVSINSIGNNLSRKFSLKQFQELHMYPCFLSIEYKRYNLYPYVGMMKILPYYWISLVSLQGSSTSHIWSFADPHRLAILRTRRILSWHWSTLYLNRRRRPRRELGINFYHSSSHIIGKMQKKSKFSIIYKYWGLYRPLAYYIWSLLILLTYESYLGF